MKRVLSLSLIPLAGAFLATAACAPIEADLPYRRALAQFCTFLTPTLVTPKNQDEGWKCAAGVADYNRLFTIDLVYVAGPEVQR